MSTADKLLKKAESFEKLAIYGDRRTFLKSLAQQNYTSVKEPLEPWRSDVTENLPSYDFSKYEKPKDDTKHGLEFVGLENPPKDIPHISNTLKNKVYPAYQAYTASYSPSVNEANTILEAGDKLLIAGRPGEKVDEYNRVRKALIDLPSKLNSEKAALLTEPKTGEEGKKIVDKMKDINSTLTKIQPMLEKLFNVYNKVSKNVGKSYLKEDF